MRGKKLCSLVLAAVVLATGVPASATSIKNIQNEKAKNAKDVSAGAVLVFAIGAAICGLIIFVPKIF